MWRSFLLCFFFFLNCTATPQIYTLSYTTLFRSKREAVAQVASRDSQRQRQREQRGRETETSGTAAEGQREADRKSTRLNSSHITNSYAAFGLKKKNNNYTLPMWKTKQHIYALCA